MTISPTVVYPAMAPHPEVDWKLLKIKQEANIDLVDAFNIHIMEKYKDVMQIYTDGTKKPETGVTGFGVVIPKKGIEINRRTSNNLGVYTVEMVAILIALRWVEKSKIDKVSFVQILHQPW